MFLCCLLEQKRVLAQLCIQQFCPCATVCEYSSSFLFSFVLGSPYYDNVRPLSYPDSDAVLICFDISRPETLDSVMKKVCCSSRANPCRKHVFKLYF